MLQAIEAKPHPREYFKKPEDRTLLNREYADPWAEVEAWHHMNGLLVGCSPCLGLDPCDSDDLHESGPSPCLGLTR